jgi:hypothetical protein
MSGIPQSSSLAQLALPEQYAAVELFRGTMVRHSVIVSRADYTAGARGITFAGSGWLDYVPIRLPDTICVPGKGPTGTAAVLINRKHAYTDLYMPIDEWQKRLFDSIDGERTIGSIVGETVPESARAFFAQLWLMDQIVFAVLPKRSPVAAGAN